MADIVYLLRHAAPAAALCGRFWGKKDPGVDPAGLLRVSAIAALAWDPPQRIFSSPLTRAQVTAAKLAPEYELRAEILPDLAEVDFGEFDGLSWLEIEQNHAQSATEWMQQKDDFSFPAGEGIPDFFTRVTEAFTLCTGAPERSVLCVTHGGVIMVWCCLFLGMPLKQRFTFSPEYAAVTAFRRIDNAPGWELVFLNNKV